MTPQKFYSAMMDHYRRALMLFNQGAHHVPVLRAANQDQLLHYREAYGDMGVTDVEIQTFGKGACKQCTPLQGRTYGINDALKLKPLPREDCESFCRCSYEPSSRMICNGR